MKNKKWFLDELGKKDEERTFAGDWRSLPSYLPVRWIESSVVELANHLMLPCDPANAIEECVNIAYLAMVLARKLQRVKELEE